MKKQLQRVSRSNPCLICGKNDWCSVLKIDDERTMVLCYRIESNESTIDGGYKHFLGPQADFNGKAAIKPPVASIARRHSVYCHLLGSFWNGDKINVQKHLLKRNLSLEQIEILDYKQIFNHADDISGRFNLENVPGFYYESDKYRWEMLYKFGFFIPIRDYYNNIAALQIRQLGNPKWALPKYLWFSTPDKPKGASSGAPLHYASIRHDNKESLLITESPLKADIADLYSKLDDNDIIGAPNVCTGHSEIIERCFSPNIKRVNIAFDMDWKKNEVVKNALIRLADRIQTESGTYVNIMMWKNQKGLDDALINNEQLVYLPFNDWRRQYGDIAKGTPSGSA